MRSDILVSIRPEFARQIVAGTKTVELRRRALRIPEGTRMWIYSTLPIGRVEAVATVRNITCARPAMLWKRFGSEVGISKAAFFDYYSGASLGWAIQIADVEEIGAEVGLSTLRSLAPTFHPPQFFKRLHGGSPLLSHLSSLV